ncbi:MAG TPA: YidC/Oxa1 family insertase periplasmic-domain containing protein, partial [Gemmataceae bacterium]|nr:YidC/Oxa1 family insertase periplasmic-domain containing protein [Gemmataceae bacterium]
ELSSKGAGVQSLTLNYFKAANLFGRPEGHNLELLPKDANGDFPAFAVYLYEKPNDNRPLDTLGLVEWKTEELKPADGNWKVAFSTEVPSLDLRITKTFTLNPGDYHLGLSVKLERLGKSTERSQFRYQLAGGHGLPIEGLWYTTTFRNALVGGLANRDVFWRDYQDSRSIGAHAGGDLVLRGDGRSIIYAAVDDQYFSSTIAVDDEQNKRDFVAYVRATEENTPPLNELSLADMAMRVVSVPIEFKPTDPAIEHKYVLYHGPAKVKLLGDSFGGSQPVSRELINRYVDKLHLDTLTDYHMQGGGPFVWISEHIASPMGWSYLLISCTNMMHMVLDWLHSFISNYGLCIIVLTFMVRGCLYPISRRQALSSRTMQEKMKVLQPEMKVLKEKFKDDFRAFSQAQQELYRKHKVNPFAGMAGCLPLLAQMPIFMGLYYSLQESPHFRLAPFLWIQNLAAPDMLIGWGEKIPWISEPSAHGGLLYLGPYFNILPVLAAGLMLVQQKMMMPPAMDEQQEMQQKMTKYMTLFFCLMFYKMAAGLCIYFIVSSTWGLIERKMLPKKKADLPDAAVPAAQSTNGVPRNGAPKPGKPGNRKQPEKDKKENEGTLQNKAQKLWAELLKQARKK